jgi:hypothetical protein
MNYRFSFGRVALILASGAAIAAGLAACGPSRGGGPEFTTQQGVVTTSDGTQQFPVPASGRSLLAQRLTRLVSGHITDARISNGWRTAAAAQAHPDDYAACVSADAGRGPEIFLIVKSGPGTGDVISGVKAAQRCADGARVTQWTTLPEAMGQS